MSKSAAKLSLALHIYRAGLSGGGVTVKQNDDKEEGVISAGVRCVAYAL